MAQQIEKTVLINALPATVWSSLTTPEWMKQWMGEPEMNIEIITDWKEGSSILIRGFHHIQFESKGTVLQYDPDRVLQYTHLSSVSRLPDMAENYSIITFILTPVQQQTSLSLKIENFPTETIFKHLDFYWRTAMEVLKRFIERQEHVIK